MVKNAKLSISLLLAFLIGLILALQIWYLPDQQLAQPSSDLSADPTPPDINVADLVREIHPHGGVTLPVVYGDIGPQLIQVGAIHLDAFTAAYEQAGQPLTPEQLEILQSGSNEAIVIDQENAYFLLNLFWALGLTNQNVILTDGQMMDAGASQVGRFASTGGWTLGNLDPTDLFASQALVALTADQHNLVEIAANLVYRPCCINHTGFPDCNHGMAMLGFLELMAAQDASLEEMLVAAKYINAYWFSSQAYDLALFFKAADGLNFSEVPTREAMSVDYFSSYGYAQVRNWLASRSLLQENLGDGSGCGV